MACQSPHLHTWHTMRYYQVLPSETSLFTRNLGDNFYVFVSFLFLSVAEWSARRTRNPVSRVRVPLWRLAGFALGRPEFKSHGHACKWPTGCLLPVRSFNPVMLYLIYLFLSI